MRILRIAAVLWLLYVPLGVSGQGAANSVNDSLVGQPLYLRGLWMADKLAFDGDGKLLSESRAGSLTLSGMDVDGVSTHGKDLVVRGERVALLLGPEGRLERRKVENTTLMFGTFQKKYVAHEEMSVTVHPDSGGSFDTALKLIFANGLPELARSVPIYWKCYAQAYFTQNGATSDAERVVRNCVAARSLASSEDREAGDYTPLRVLAPVAPQYTPVAAAFGFGGTSEVHVTVTADGSPVGFQIVRAIGGGLDEQSLAAIYQYKFQPATRNGRAVNADIDLTIQFGGAR